MPRQDGSNVGAAIEYGLIAALIAVVILTAATALGYTIKSRFDTVAQRRASDSAMSGRPTRAMSTEGAEKFAHIR